MSTEDTLTEQRALQRARFIDRFVAFSFDYFLLLLASYAALYLTGRVMGPAAEGNKPLLVAWLTLWLATLLCYHAYLSSDGRQTLGKRLLGVQVFTQDGMPPSFGKALLRSVCYLVSSLCFGLGFLWALFDPQRRAWHDRIAGTMVLETREKSTAVRAGIWVAAVFCFLGGAALVILPGASPYAEQMEILANAKESLGALARFEEVYKVQTGTYTDNLTELGKLYGNPQEFMLLLSKTLDIRSLRIQANRDRFMIEARALDENASLYRVSGPPPKQQNP